MNSAADTAASSFRQRMFRTHAEDVLPLKIAHQRIYILPTRRGLAFLLSLLIMLIASVNYALSLGYALCFLLTGMFAASLLSTYRNVAGISVEKIKTNHCFAGESAVFQITVDCASKLDRIGVTVKSKFASDCIDIKANTLGVAQLSIPTTSRGICKLGRLTLTSTYPIGLWRSWCYVHSDEHALVYPSPEIQAPPIHSEQNDAQGENASRSTQGDIAGLREYQPGDAPSTIAWKAAARGQGLFVKEHEQEQVGGTVHLNFAATGLSDTEEQLERLSAWILNAEQQNREYAFTVADCHLEANNGKEHKEQALSALAMFGLAR